MKYGIISDVHGNLEAFEAVLNSLKDQRVEAVFCTGDIVGYGANPKECLDIFQELGIKSVAGNHDWAVAGRLDASYFTPAGKEAVHWSREKIGFENISYLANLPLTHKQEQFILVHGSLDEPLRFNYLYDIALAEESFRSMDCNLCFIGHTHKPQVFIQRRDQIIFSEIFEFDVQPENKYIINVGSVGQPRDGVPLASYCIYDTDLKMIEIKRVQYDISSAQRKILEAGLPESLANRLSLGK